MARAAVAATRLPKVEFETRSKDPRIAALAETTCPKEGERGACKAYRHIFTFGVWKDLGYIVRKGEHGAKLNVNGGRFGATVFCRHQVEPLTDGE